MAWSGEFFFGDMWAAYYGAADHNALHAHAALQIGFSPAGRIHVQTESGAVISGAAVSIRPMVQHAISADGDVGLLYIEPQSPVAVVLLQQAGGGDVERLPVGIAAHFSVDRPLAEWLTPFRDRYVSAENALDPRLLLALDALRTDLRPGAVARATAASGLSDSRLRSLAHEQLGLPLSTWILWRKLERTSREVAAGLTIAEAAVAGGFADQAHFARTMRRMFGVTPKMASQALR